MAKSMRPADEEVLAFLERNKDDIKKSPKLANTLWRPNDIIVTLEQVLKKAASSQDISHTAAWLKPTALPFDIHRPYSQKLEATRADTDVAAHGTGDMKAEQDPLLYCGKPGSPPFNTALMCNAYKAFTAVRSLNSGPPHDHTWQAALSAQYNRTHTQILQLVAPDRKSVV